MKKLNAFLVSVLSAAALNAAVIEQVIVRQQWPWSTDVKVEYKLSGVTKSVDLTVNAFNGDVQLTLPASAIAGDLYGISEDGIGQIVIDPIKAFGAGKVALANFKVKLTVSESAANIGEVLYKIYDLENGTCEDVTRAGLLNGKYGSIVTDYTKLVPGCKPAVSDLLIWTDVTNRTDCMTTKLVMRKIAAKGQTFTMGSPTSEIGRTDTMDKTKDGTNPTGRETQHNVTLTNDYYIGVFEITQKQYNLMTGKWPSKFTMADCRESRPVEPISYDNLRGTKSIDGRGWPTNRTHAVTEGSALDNLRKKFANAPLFDLPTEAEWEFACRAGTTTAWYNGTNPTTTYYYTNDKNLSKLARYLADGGFIDPHDYTKSTSTATLATLGTTNGTARVGSYLPNAFGLYDMLGNVAEWCLDYYDAFSAEPVTSPCGPTFEEAWVSEWGYRNRVLKGGAWSDQMISSRAASRAHDTWSQAQIGYGARLCLTIVE